MENNSEKRPATDGRQDQEYLGVGSFMLEIIKIVALAFIIIVPIRVFLFQPFFVQGASMEPNFEDGQYLIINELGYKETDLGFVNIESFKELARQEVVVFRYPLDTSKYFIKRVIGLPGEKIEIKKDKITIFNQNNPDGFTLDESEYISRSVKTDGDRTVTLKDDEYFVMGDNRQHSNDSRTWGPVPKNDIVGRVLLRAWPLGDMAVFK